MVHWLSSYSPQLTLFIHGGDQVIKAKTNKKKSWNLWFSNSEVGYHVKYLKARLVSRRLAASKLHKLVSSKVLP